MKTLTLELTEDDVRDLTFCISKIANDYKFDANDKHITDMQKQTKTNEFNKLYKLYRKIVSQYETHILKQAGIDE